MYGRRVTVYGVAPVALMVCLFLAGPANAADDQGVAVGGVGIVLDTQKDATGEPAFMVRGLMEGMPAAEAGVKEGDRITHVDGAPLAGLELKQVVELIRGEAGTQLKLTLQREGQDDPVEVTLERKQLGPTLAAGDRETRERLAAERAEQFQRMAAEQAGGAGGNFLITVGPQGQRVVQMVAPGVAGMPQAVAFQGSTGARQAQDVPVQLEVAGDYVYVVRGYTLYQFKVEGLALVAKVDLRTDEEKEVMARQPQVWGTIQLPVARPAAPAEVLEEG
jgi:membrane-associated protease RseP (regulator of RpoE activity)